jgi:NAD(P)-dependent dehydrogenase (short-subunit alcohol dehydrogenase family)
VAQRGAGPRGEQRGAKPPAWRECVVTDGVYAAVHGAQPSCRNAVLDRAASEPERYELPPVDDAAEARCDRGDALVYGTISTKASYVMHNVEPASGIHVRSIPRRRAGAPTRHQLGTLTAHNRDKRTHSSVLAVLRRRLLEGVGITVVGDAPHVARVAHALGAGEGRDVLVYAAQTPTDADGTRKALDDAWDAIRATMLPPDRGLIVLIAPPPGNPHTEAARAGLENLARTLSIEWARHGIRPVAILPGPDTGPETTAELTAFLASRAGAYYAGCAFTLR